MAERSSKEEKYTTREDDIVYKEVEKNVYKLAKEINFDLNRSCTLKGKPSQVEAFEPLVTALQELICVDNPEAHLLLGYLFERGLVAHYGLVSGIFLSDVGARYHYYTAIQTSAIRKKELEKKFFEEKKINFFKTQEVVKSADKTRSWRLKKSCVADYYFNLGIEYEIKCDASVEPISKQYYSGWAQYFYELSGAKGWVTSVSEECQKRSLFNLGMLYKLGKGQVGKEMHTDFNELPRIEQGLIFLQQAHAKGYGPASYEIYKILKKGISKKYRNRREMKEVFNEAYTYLSFSFAFCYGPAMKKIAQMKIYGEREKITSAERKKRLQEAAENLKSAEKWYTDTGMTQEAEKVKAFAELIEKSVKDSGIIVCPYYNIMMTKFTEYIHQRLLQIN